MSDLDGLREWLADRLGGARIDGADRVTFGHSAEMMLLTLALPGGGREEVVLRLRPPAPGLLEPYDMARQYAILAALRDTDVRAPAVLALDATGEVLGRPFYVMRRLPGTVYETEVPPELGPAEIRRMTEGIVEQLAAIHLVDVATLPELGDGGSYLDDQLAHWDGELRRVRRGPLPALERLHALLVERRPAPSAAVTLVHGDPKPGNFAFAGGEVTGVFDWEMAGLGDPLADLGYVELLWDTPGFLTSRPGALTADEALAYHAELTGVPAGDRAWYRAMQGFKTAVILLVGAMLFDAGHSDDLRFAQMAYAIPSITEAALGDLGAPAEGLDHGPVRAGKERYKQVRDRVASAGPA